MQCTSVEEIAKGGPRFGGIAFGDVIPSYKIHSAVGGKLLPDNVTAENLFGDKIPSYKIHSAVGGKLLPDNVTAENLFGDKIPSY
ncbi:MAG: hypothetical protein CSH37_11915 [Thalassolituus sp.]|nr:MAG: hypothetical protein CSH37_11915 [Thalassolituus sp.]